MKVSHVLVTLALTSAVFSATADVKINGFASIKGGATLGGDENLYKYTDEFSFKNETLAGIQVTADLKDKLSFTAQFVGRGNDDYNATFEWAYLSYQLADNLKLNAGRLKTPFYKYTDFIDVGYAYDWVRVPQAVYNLNFTSLDGMSLYYTSELMGWESSLLLNIGTNDGTPEIGGKKVRGSMRNGYAIAWELSNGPLTVRLAHLGGKLTAHDEDLQGFTSMLRQAGLSQLASAVLLDDDKATFNGLALSYDKNDWVIIGEITQTKLDDSVISDQNGYYISVGRRFDSVTPYISFENRDNEAKSELYNALSPQLPFYNPLVQIVHTFEIKSDTWNIGARYDFHPSAAFKVQLSHSDNKTRDDKATLLTFGIDLVF